MGKLSLAALFLIFCFTACGGSDSTPSADAAPPGTPDAAPPGTPDAGPGPGVACGNQTCQNPQVCCVTVQGDAGSAMCTAANACQGAAAACDGPEDCGGHACCGMIQGQMATVTCAAGDTCGQGSIQACHKNDDCPAQGQTAGECCVTGTTGYCKFPGQPNCQ